MQADLQPGAQRLQLALPARHLGRVGDQIAVAVGEGVQRLAELSHQGGDGNPAVDRLAARGHLFDEGHMAGQAALHSHGAVAADDGGRQAALVQVDQAGLHGHEDLARRSHGLDHVGQAGTEHHLVGDALFPQDQDALAAQGRALHPARCLDDRPHRFGQVG